VLLPAGNGNLTAPPFVHVLSGNRGWADPRRRTVAGRTSPPAPRAPPRT